MVGLTSLKSFHPGKPSFPKGRKIRLPGNDHWHSSFIGGPTVFAGSFHYNPFNLPKKLFKWLYSISFILLSIIWIGFCSVMPIDAIVQSRASSNFGVKTFVILGACVLFVVAVIIVYLTRIYQSRLQSEDIPKLYVPGESDVPKKVYQAIKSNLRVTENIRQMAAPNEFVNHPSLSPPEYVQLLNEQQIQRKGLDFGNSLPPNISYEEVLRSVGDKIKYDNLFLTTDIKIPKNLSYRDILLLLPREHFMKQKHKFYANDSPSFSSESMPSLTSAAKDVQDEYVKIAYQLIDIYEKLRFSGKPINQEDFIEFMVHLNAYFENFHEILRNDLKPKDININNPSEATDPLLGPVFGDDVSYWDPLRRLSTSSSVQKYQVWTNPSRGDSLAPPVLVSQRSRRGSPSGSGSAVDYNESLRRSSMDSVMHTTLRPNQSNGSPLNEGDEELQTQEEYNHFHNILSTVPSGNSGGSMRSEKRFRGIIKDHLSLGQNTEDDEEYSDFYNFRSKPAYGSTTEVHSGTRMGEQNSLRRYDPQEQSGDARGRSSSDYNFGSSSTDSLAIYQDPIPDVEIKHSRPTRSHSPIKKFTGKSAKMIRQLSSGMFDGSPFGSRTNMNDLYRGEDTSNPDMPGFMSIRKSKRDSEYDGDNDDN